jgi:hypothetical protein
MLRTWKGGAVMSTMIGTAGGEDIMTDFQFKAIIKMVLTIARRTRDADAIIKELEKILPEDERDED